MDKYKIGTVFELYENDSQEYMIINNLEKEEYVYILVVPVYNIDKELKADYSKVMLLKVNKETDNMDIETDMKIIKEVVDDTFSYLFRYSLRSRFAREYLSSASAYKTPRIIAAMANKTMKNQYPPLLPPLAVMTVPDKVLICPLSSILANLAMEPSSFISKMVPSFDMRYVLSMFSLISIFQKSEFLGMYFYTIFQFDMYHYSNYLYPHFPNH